MKKRAVLAALGVVIMTTLAGCGGSAATISTGAVAQAAPVGFVAAGKAGEFPINLAVEPFEIGKNTFVVTSDAADIAEVETQVVMLEMGHGAVLEMTQTGPGRYEVESPVLNMGGKWMLRVKVTDAKTGEEKQAIFYGKVTE